MIDWYLVGFGALWILGLAVGLAALSLADYEAHQRQMRVREVLRGTEYQLALSTAGALFGLGLAGSARAWWELALWVGLGLAFTYQAGRAAAELARDKGTKQAGEAGGDEQGGRGEG